MLVDVGITAWYPDSGEHVSFHCYVHENMLREAAWSDDDKYFQNRHAYKHGPSGDTTRPYVYTYPNGRTKPLRIPYDSDVLSKAEIGDWVKEKLDYLMVSVLLFLASHFTDKTLQCDHPLSSEPKQGSTTFLGSPGVPVVHAEPKQVTSEPKQASATSDQKPVSTPFLGSPGVPVLPASGQTVAAGPAVAAAAAPNTLMGAQTHVQTPKQAACDHNRVPCLKEPDKYRMVSYCLDRTSPGCSGDNVAPMLLRCALCGHRMCRKCWDFRYPGGKRRNIPLDYNRRFGQQNARRAVLEVNRNIRHGWWVPQEFLDYLPTPGEIEDAGETEEMSS